MTGRDAQIATDHTRPPAGGSSGHLGRLATGHDSSVGSVERILPDLGWWTTSHPVLGIEVSSYWREDAGVVFDPLVLSPADLDWFAARPVPPSAILLSNRHHYRSSRAFVARFGCPVLPPGRAS